MTDFASMISGMDAEARQEMIDSAQKFMEHRGDYETCLFCGKSLTDLVCDAPNGFEMAGYKDPVPKTPFTKAVDGYRYLDSKSEMFTCDLPVCSSCRTTGEPIFFCGGTEERWFRESLGEGSHFDPSGVFVPDLCPLHRDASSLGTTQQRNRVITRDEAEAWRRQARMMIEGGKKEKVQPYPQVAE